MKTKFKQDDMKRKTSSVSTPVTELEYGPTGLTDGVHGELAAAPAYRDLAKGAHSTFIKMPSGYVSPTHTHTEDYWAVVISGVTLVRSCEKIEVELESLNVRKFAGQEGRFTPAQVSSALKKHITAQL